ncbi:MAG: ABC transporter permease [bacterium]|nr:ABC transporter permease [bacterium]MCP5070075.1 ABC transporter permease [bacterium]
MTKGFLGSFLEALVRSVTWRMAWRNVGRNPRRTLIVGSAIAIGLGSTIVAMAVNYGMIFEMVASAIRTEVGHVQIHGQGFDAKPSIDIRIEPGQGVGPGLVEDLPEVVAWAPRVRDEGLVSSPRASVGVRLVAIDPDREAKVSVIEESITQGQFLGDEPRQVLIGERLADRLQVGVDDKVVFSVQDVTGDLTGEAYRIAGLFRTPSRGLDEGALFLPIAEAQRLLGIGEAISEFVIISNDDRQLEALAARLEERLGADFEVRTWEELRPMLVSMVKIFDQMGWIMYAAIFVAMAFGIANVLLMSLYERIREIGIVLSLGMPPARLVASLLVESLVLTLVGVAFGLALGLLGVWAVSDGIDLSAWADGLDAYGMSPVIVPVVRSSDLTQPVAIAVLTAILASLWPAVRAVRIRPAEAVRHV